MNQQMHVYPPEVYWKKEKVLKLTDECKITAITHKQYNIIMWVASNRKDISENWEQKRIEELKAEIYKQRVIYDFNKHKFTVEGLKFYPSDILLIGEDMPSAPQQNKYFLSKVIQETKYWYHYGKDWYDYFGCGRVEFVAAWHIIQNVIGMKDFYLILKTN